MQKLGVELTILDASGTALPETVDSNGNVVVELTPGERFSVMVRAERWEDVMVFLDGATMDVGTIAVGPTKDLVLHEWRPGYPFIAGYMPTYKMRLPKQNFDRVSLHVHSVGRASRESLDVYIKPKPSSDEDALSA